MSKYLTPVLVLAVAVLAVALFIKGGEVITAYDVSSVNTTAPTLNITDQPPTVHDVACYDYNLAALGDMGSNPLALRGGTQANVTCNGTVIDENGAEYINGTVSGNVTGAIYETTQGPTCDADNGDCIKDASCSPTSIINATAHLYTCEFLVWYMADNTSDSGSYTGFMNADDGAVANLGNDTSDTFDVDELLAVGVPGELAFGTASPGEKLSVNKSHTVTNYGNIRMDLQLNGSNPGMTCDSAQNVPTGNIKYNCTDDQVTLFDGYGSILTTTASSANCTTFNLVESDTASGTPTATTDDTWWGVEVPLGVFGDCEGTIWFTAIEG